MALAQRCWVLGSSPCAAPSACGQRSSSGWAAGPMRCGWEARMGSLRAILLPPPQQRPRMLRCASAGRGGTVCAQSQASSDTTGKPPLMAEFKHVLLPIIDRNPYLSESTRQAAATTTALAKNYGADITVLVIDQDPQEATDAQEAKDKRQVKLKTIRWHLAEGGFEDYTLVERLGEGQKPAAVIGELADDLGLDLVIICMEAIHNKHIDGNLLVEFVPCPVLMLPL